MAELPKKLKKDAIAEALVELRFDTDEIPEIVVGRLSDNPAWKGFRQTRTPLAELPSAIRLSDPNLRYQAMFDLREIGGHRNVKFGPNVISFHITGVYCGWSAFKPQIDALVQFLFDRVKNVSVRRIGLRYINNLTPIEHQVKGVEDLDLKIEVSGSQLTKHLNLNYQVDESEHMRVIVRVASADFVDGPTRPGMSAYIDVDVFTLDRFRGDSPNVVNKWVEEAHQTEKKVFFSLLPDQIIEALREE